MEAIAPTMGSPAARKPPKTTIMTRKLIGRAMPSPVRRSSGIWPTIASTRLRTPPRWSREAPVSVASRSKTVSTCAAAVASCSAVLLRSKVTTVAKPPSVRSADAPSSVSARPSRDVGPSGTTNGLAAEVTRSMAVRSATALWDAVATAGSVRSTPSSSWVYVLNPVTPASRRRSRPVMASPSTVISPLCSRSNSESVPRAPSATAKPAVTKTTQATTTQRA